MPTMLTNLAALAMRSCRWIAVFIVGTILKRSAPVDPRLAVLVKVIVLAGLFLGACLSADAAGPEKAFCETSDVRASIRPDAGGGPTAVTLGLRLTDLTEINDVSQTLTGEFLIRQRWIDPRLAHLEGCELPRNAVWSPKLAFINSGRLFPVFPDTVSVGAAGAVTYLQAFYGTLSSYEKLENFPFDEHEFKIWLVSTRYSEEALEIVVDQKFTGRRDLLNISDWIVGSVSANSGQYFFHATDSFQSLYELVIEAKRIKSFYIWKIFLPLCLIVAMSWSVFWINPTHFGPQIGISATSMLTIIAFLFTTTSIVPKLGYFTVFDRFLGISLIFVFLAFLEALLTTYLVSLKQEEMAVRLDQVSRVLFPVAFLLATALVLPIFR